MQASQNQSKVWVKPEMVRIGTIGDVAASNNNGTAQCANGNPACPTINKS